ncbi:NAD(P)H-hydrate dehydratase [Aliivibrio kagoshimensis]|uniref:NAD(P)H-hydrate dehydratase n=1 Tax=Aliivibrio kagoshimensis TaxID=2910230 RepID=UPI003D0EA1A4
MSVTPAIQPLPVPLHLSSTVREGEKEAARALNISMFDLMQRAGQSVFSVIEQRFNHGRHILVVAGIGNNGGDGFVVARLALQSGYQVTVWQVGNSARLSEGAQRAKQQFLDVGGEVQSPQAQIDEDIDLIVDAILGTGIAGQVRPDVQGVIDTINQSKRPIIAVDIPSGLDSDSGRILGCAIRATLTITFIAVKQGAVTGQARRVTGELLFAGLGVDHIFTQQNPTQTLLTHPDWLNSLSEREQDSHKGSHGRLLIAGGAEGMSGAAYLAAAASLRAGAGLTAVICHDSSCGAIRGLLPEAMVATQAQLTTRLTWCSVICLGVGLGRDEWGETLYNTLHHHTANNEDIPKLIDADGLFWLANSDDQSEKWQNLVITPHPGEAAMLLDCDISEVEANRYQTVLSLCKKYRCITVLKGAGTLISDGETVVVCHAGNAGMATGGMGDLLAGIITALLGQGYTPMRAATLGTLLHSMAADHEAQQFGEVGMVASDLLSSIRLMVNKRALTIE